MPSSKNPTTTEHLRVGTRSSPLALWQTNWIISELQARFPSLTIETTVIKTTGDKILDSPLSLIGDKGLFTKEIEKALLDGEIDLAVHSMKDVPTLLPDGLIISAVTEREDIRDVFISHPDKKYSTFAEIPSGAGIATGSLRRKSQLLHHRPDLSIHDIRGNLQTRRKKLEDSDWAGMLLARAGVKRLGWDEIISEILSADFILPAVGQGALAIETRANDEPTKQKVQILNHPETRVAVESERALLRKLEGGCQVPIGTHGRIENGQLKLDAMIAGLEGTPMIRGTRSGSPEDAEKMGIDLAEELFRKGGDKILESIRKSHA